jgi:hypothetical protein
LLATLSRGYGMLSFKPNSCALEDAVELQTMYTVPLGCSPSPIYICVGAPHLKVVTSHPFLLPTSIPYHHPHCSASCMLDQPPRVCSSGSRYRPGAAGFTDRTVAVCHLPVDAKTGHMCTQAGTVIVLWCSVMAQEVLLGFTHVVEVEVLIDMRYNRMPLMCPFSDHCHSKSRRCNP